MIPNNTPPQEIPTRRNFLKWAWAGLGALVVAEAGVMSVAFSLPRIAEGDFGSVVTAGQVEDFPPNSVTPFNQSRFYLSRLEDGEMKAGFSLRVSPASEMWTAARSTLRRSHRCTAQAAHPHPAPPLP